MKELQKIVADRYEKTIREIVLLRGELNRAKSECNRLTDSGSFVDRRQAQELSRHVDFYYELICCRQVELDFLDRFNDSSD